MSKGFIELSPDVFKEYFDAIVYSGRDKEYYSSHGLNYMNPNDIIPSYSTEEYLNLLFVNRVISEEDFLNISDDLSKKKMYNI